MVLRKINYQTKLFLPIVIILWGIILLAAFINRQRERQYRTENIRHRIEYINSRLISLYDRGEDISNFLKMLTDYFETSSLQHVSIAIYDAKTQNLITDTGFKVPPPEKISITTGSIMADQIQQENGLGFADDQVFYYAATPGENIIVQTVLPMDDRIENIVKSGSWWMVFALISIGIVTLITFLSTRHLTRNIRLLKRFADNAANNRDFAAVDDFPNDELGDISRQIVNIHNARSAAIASREFEHRVALKATRDRANFKRQMTNNINHELKTPVGIIKGYVDTIMDNPEMDEAAKNHFLKKTKEQVERLCDLLNDLSTMTRLEEGSSKIELEEIDFNEFVAELAVEAEESGLTNGMAFEYNLPDNCVIKGNKILLRAALTNLLKNAANYSHGTEMGIKYMTRNKKLYTFVFYDNGDGVGEEHIPRLFERFYRVDQGRSRKAGGTGLGLPIVLATINTMGGSISVRNGETRGLEFIFTLPAATPAAQTPRRKSAEPKSSKDEAQ